MILRLVLTIIGWSCMLILQLLLMRIARFFEQSSHSRTYHQLYAVPIMLTTVAAIIYTIRAPLVRTWPALTGNPLANAMLLIAGLMLFVLSSMLHDKMLRGSQP